MEQEAYYDVEISHFSHLTYRRKRSLRVFLAFIGCVATTIHIGSDCACSSVSCKKACSVSITRGSNVPNGSSDGACETTAVVTSARVNHVSNFSTIPSFEACELSFATIHHIWDLCSIASKGTVAASILAHLAGESKTSIITGAAIPSTLIRAGGGGVAIAVIDEAMDTINVARRARRWWDGL